MTTGSAAQCFACTRLVRTTDPDSGAPTAVRCTAYPQGIPMEIGLLGADHRQPRGDEVRGLTFNRETGTEADDAWTWWQRKAEAMAR